MGMMIDVVGMMIDVVGDDRRGGMMIDDDRRGGYNRGYDDRRGGGGYNNNRTIVTLDMVMDAKAEVKVDKMNWDITDHYEKINELKPNYLVT